MTVQVLAYQRPNPSQISSEYFLMSRLAGHTYTHHVSPTGFIVLIATGQEPHTVFETILIC